MSSVRVPTLRHVASSCSLRPIRSIPHRRWAQVHDVRFLATVHPAQHIQEKYSSKLKQKAQAEGHESIEDLKSAYSDQIKAQRRKDAVEGGEKLAQVDELLDPLAAAADSQALPRQQQQQKADATRSSSTTGAKSSRGGSGEKQAVQTLDDFIKLEKVRNLPEKELTTIWRLRHASNPHKLCAVIPSATYREMEQVAKSSPQFILPVPHKDQGAEIHFLQWTWDEPSKTSTVLFTQLAEYKQRGEFAQPHTTVTHHLDLAADRGLVFMQGQVMEDRGVQPEEAKWLVMSLQRFYGGWEGAAELDGQRRERAEERKKLLEYFARGDSRFSVDKLLEEAERMG